MWKFTNFSATQILREINFRKVVSSEINQNKNPESLLLDLK